MSNYFVGVDFAKGGDYSCYQIWKRPSRLRKLLRRTGLDKSVWEYKLIKQWFEPPTPVDSKVTEGE